VVNLTVLRLAYLANIAILLPVCASLFFRGDSGTLTVFEGRWADSPGLRYLCASLWSGVLLCSAAGLVWPRFFLPLLVFQCVYKTVFLLTYALPLARQGNWQAIPPGLSGSFVIIVLVFGAILAASR
jgi:hypothetical protein